jgi:hypothetical protein
MRSGGSKLVLVGQVIAGLMSFLALAITANYVGAKTFGFCFYSFISGFGFSAYV